MVEKMAPDCGESRLEAASCRHDRRQETCSARAAKGRASKARSTGEAQEGRRDRRATRPRTDALRRLAVQRQGDRLLMRKNIFAPGFKALPWWWEAWTPNNALSQDPPARTQVVIIGAGYGGLSTALELRRNGIDCVVL